ncbi:uncharacterized protein PG998_014201 [Apiospora kogelbergensis]|uniref:uncharacterized protein n=1 Tax=Apiospora kogelbergensis TaxID=1337665 RepID=UPI00312D3048
MVSVLPEGIHNKDGTPGGPASESGERHQGPGEEAVETTQCGLIDPRLLELAGNAGVEEIACSPTADPADADAEYYSIEGDMELESLLRHSGKGAHEGRDGAAELLVPTPEFSDAE